MATGFWQQLKKPIFALAPMANVTDAAFRRIIAKYGKPAVMWTEFVSCDGLCSAGREALLRDLWFTEAERPIVAQFFGSKPEHFYRCALLAQELGFDGIDINMGCPDGNVEKQNAGAALIREPKLAQKVIAETKRGAGKLPVSVKTRIGYTADILDAWIPQLLETGPAAITVHARTRKEMSLVPARWDAVARAVEIARRYDSSSSRTLIIGNGDVASMADGEEKIRQSGADGAMVGRGIFGNPWFFANLSRAKRDGQVEHPELAEGLPTVEQKFSVMLEHSFLFEELFAGVKGFDVMKKHYKAYVHGFEGAKELRTKLMNARNVREAVDIVRAQYP